MFRFYKNNTSIFATMWSVLAIGIISSATLTIKAQQDLDGRELLSITRVAQGGEGYNNLRYLTTRSTGFVNVAPIVGAGLGTGGASSVVEVKFIMTDYQSNNSRRRLNVTLATPMAGETFLVYTGNSGGGMYMGNEFRVSEAAASRHWGLMGFSTLNRAIDGQLRTDRLRDENYNYVIEVKFNSTDSLRYWIDKRTFLINKVVSYYNGKVLVEEDRSDYRRVNCLTLPYRIITKLGGQRVSDLNIDSYDLETILPDARFTITVSER